MQTYPHQHPINRLVALVINLILALYPLNTGASESFFAQSFVRNILSIEIQDEKIIEKKLKKPVPQAVPEKISVLVWNIYKGELFPPKELPLNIQGYNFTLLQESTGKIMEKYFARPGWSYFLPTFKRDDVTTGTALLTEHKANQFQGLHSHYREPFIITPKSSMVVDFGSLRIINVHALNFVPIKEWKYELDRILKKTDKEYVILGGDFNSWDDERHDYLIQKTKEKNLAQVTFKKDKRTKVNGFPIDYIFAKGFSLRSAIVMDVSRFSDHMALEVVLQRLPPTDP